MIKIVHPSVLLEIYQRINKTKFPGQSSEFEPSGFVVMVVECVVSYGFPHICINSFLCCLFKVVFLLSMKSSKFSMLRLKFLESLGSSRIEPQNLSILVAIYVVEERHVSVIMAGDGSWWLRSE